MTFNGYVAPRWVASSRRYGIPILDQVWAIAHASFSAELPGETLDDGSIWLFIGPPHPNADLEIEVLVDVYGDDRAAVVFHAMGGGSRFVVRERGCWGGKGERKFAELSTRLAAPDTVWSAPTEIVTGESAAERGRTLLCDAYGSSDVLDTVLRAANWHLTSDQLSEDFPPVQGRIPLTERIAFDGLIARTGRDESELIREAVHLLLEQHRTPS